MPDHSSNVPRALAGRYAVDREVGRGGMATVYVADDLRHKRRVAVKILHDSVASSVGVDRFLREIEIAAKLAHPHILPLYDSGEADGTIFYVIPYVDGSTLRARLVRDGRLPRDDALSVARAMAGALDYAHRNGVVHRDVKPENILFQDGQPLLADFGIALALDAAADTRLTRAGFSLGTPAYMSPEQCVGDPDTDGRADQYALASVLAEMLVGEPPFGCGNAHIIIGRRFSSIAPRLRSADPTVPEVVDIAVARALSRVPDERFTSVAEFARALRTSNTPTVSATASYEEHGGPSILVLPFINLSQNAEDAYFADGLSEELMTRLSKVSSLRVISRSSAMSLKGTRKDAATVGRELTVRYVLEGSVRRAGNNVRIAAQLTEVTTASSLWGEGYTGSLDDVFAIQESIARRIVEALELRLTPEESRRVWHRSPTDVGAWEWYQQARQEMWHTTPEALQRAERLIARGLEVTGGSLMLEALQGVVGAMYLAYYLSDDEGRYARGEASARKVLDARPDLPHGHVIQALILYRKGQMQESAAAFSRALAADPNDPDALMWLARHHIWAGKLEVAKPLLDRLRAVDPLTPKNRHAYGYFEAVSGRFESAAAIFREWMDLDYANPIARWWLAHVLARGGRVSEAIAMADMSDEISAGNPGVRQSLKFLKHTLLGHSADAEAALMELTTTGLRIAREDETMPWFIGGGYALLGERQKAMEWLEVAVSRGFLNYRVFETHDPFLAGLRAEPRFVDLVAQMRRRSDAFDVNAASSS